MELIGTPAKGIPALEWLLHQEGLKLVIDDFDTGYSSLSYLSRLPLDSLKIDRVFVRDMLRDIRQPSIVRGIISLAKSLNLTVVAEGVETEAQARMLRREDCHLLQGFLFSPPVPAEDMETWLRF